MLLLMRRNGLKTGTASLHHGKGLIIGAAAADANTLLTNIRKTCLNHHFPRSLIPQAFSLQTRTVNHFHRSQLHQKHRREPCEHSQNRTRNQFVEPERGQKLRRNMIL